MFDKLTTSFQRIFKNLRGYGKLSEQNIQEALREVRMALLEADVSLPVVKDFIAKVREKSIGIEVLDSVTPGQQVIKFVHDEMVALLGGQAKEFDLSGKPATVMLIGLHGSGKTTTAGKLANKWKKSGKTVLLVACDIRRPAAVDQLKILAGQAGVGIVTPTPGETVPALGARALQHATQNRFDVAIFDTGGRFQIDGELVQELKDLREAIQPKNTVLVVDAAIGQESVHVAETFHKEVGLTGLILTKLDGDARGGAALSVQAVTHCPILLVGVGEKMDNLEAFHPDRMASRILGMGDVLSLVEKAQAAMEGVDATEMAEMQEKILSDDLDLEDFLAQIKQVRGLGSIEDIIGMLPGAGKLKNMQVDESQLTKVEAIIHSMTREERNKPQLLNASRKKRIAAGSGTQVQDVNRLLKQFEGTKAMMKQFGNMGKKKKGMLPKFF